MRIQTLAMGGIPRRNVANGTVSIFNFSIQILLSAAKMGSNQLGVVKNVKKHYVRKTSLCAVVFVNK